MKKLLILGGGHSEIPLIQAAKSMGFYTITTGNNRDGLGHSYAHEYIFADFSDQNKILEIVKDHKIDFLIPSCNDFAILTAAFVNEHIKVGHFDSYQITKYLHHKTSFKILASKLNLSVARSYTLKKHDDPNSMNLSYPLIVKPIDLSGGKGMTKVFTASLLGDAINTAFTHSREDSILLEEFIEGTHHSASLLIRNGRIIFQFFADEYFYINNYLVEGAYNNPLLNKQIRQSILKDAKTLIEHLHLTDGLLHIQFIVRENMPYILEVTRRSPGDLYLELVRHATGVDFAKTVIQLHTQTLNKPIINSTTNRYILRHCIMGDQNGTLHKVHIDERLKKHIFDQYMWYHKGDKVENYLTYKAGIIFASFNNLQTLKFVLSNIHTFVQVEVAT